MKGHNKSGLLLLASFLGFFAFCFSSDALAVNEGALTYSITGNQCYIVSCNASATGEIIVPDTVSGAVVTAVNSNAFKDCTAISSIVLPETIKSIGDNAFSGCSNLVSVVIPDSVIELGDSLFYKCSNLINVSLSDSITEIPENTFYFCKRLQSIELPSGITEVGKNAFYGCSLLNKIILPESTTSVMDLCFKGCSALESIYIPSGISRIGTDAFADCEKLYNVYYSGKTDLLENLEIFSGNELLTGAKWLFGHIHSVAGKTNIIKATCTTDGYNEIICECGFYERSNYTAAKGHELTVFATIRKPDCTTEGLARVSCSKCDYGENMILPINSHKIVIDEKIDATCFESGKTEGSHCGVCGKVIVKQAYIPALGHDYSEKIYDSAHLVSAPTYTKAAVYRYSCVRCSAVGKNTHIGNKLILGRPAKIVSASNSNAIAISWSVVKNATGYGVFYRNSANKWVLYKKTTLNTIKFTSLPSGRKYSFAVKAYVVENGKTVASPYHQIITEATRPAKPAKIVAKQNENAIKIAWSPVSGATGYRVYGYNTRISNWVVLKTATKNCSHITENLRSGTYYKFAVRPYIDLGSKIVWCDGYSEIISATKPIAPVLKATSLAGGVRLQWSAVAGADGYVLYGSTRPDGGYVRLSVTKNLNYTISGLNRGQYFYFRAYSVKRIYNEYIFSYASDIKVAKTR